jgi:hypothetical protein
MKNRVVGFFIYINKESVLVRSLTCVVDLSGVQALLLWRPVTQDPLLWTVTVDRQPGTCKSIAATVFLVISRTVLIAIPRKQCLSHSPSLYFWCFYF